MEKPPAGKRHLLVNEVAGLLVAEVERSVCRLDEHAARCKFLQGADDLLVSAAARILGCFCIERSSEHCGGGHHLGRELTEAGDTGAEEGPDAAWDRPIMRL